MIVILQSLADKIVSLFVDATEIIRLGAYGLHLTGRFYIFLAAINMTRDILNGIRPWSIR